VPNAGHGYSNLLDLIVAVGWVQVCLNVLKCLPTGSQTNDSYCHKVHQLDYKAKTPLSLPAAHQGNMFVGRFAFYLKVVGKKKRCINMSGKKNWVDN
jgi:hypothetical protein